MSNGPPLSAYQWDEKDVATEFTRLGINLREGKGKFRFAIIDPEQIFLATFHCRWAFIPEFLPDYAPKNLKLIINGTWVLTNDQPAADIVGYAKSDTAFSSRAAKLWPGIAPTNPHITDRWAFAIKKSNNEASIAQGSSHNATTLEADYNLFLHGLPIIVDSHLDPDDPAFITDFDALNDQYNGGGAYGKLSGTIRIARGAVGILKDKRIVILSTGDGASRFDPAATRPGMTILGLAKLLSKFKFDGKDVESAVMLDGSKPHGIHACQNIDDDISTQPQQAMQHPGPPPARKGKTVSYLAAFKVENTTIKKIGSTQVPVKHTVSDGSVGVIDTPPQHTDALPVTFRIEPSDHFKKTEKVELYVMSISAYNSGQTAWPGPEKTWTGASINYNSDMVWGLKNLTTLKNLSDASPNGVVCMVRSLDAGGKQISNHAISFQVKPRFAEILSGLVKDAGGGGILDNVDVTATGEGAFSEKRLTDLNGRFQITDVPFGNTSLTFEIDGWEKTEKKLKIDKKIIDIEVSLKYDFGK